MTQTPSTKEKQKPQGTTQEIEFRKCFTALNQQKK